MKHKRLRYLQMSLKKTKTELSILSLIRELMIIPNHAFNRWDSVGSINNWKFTFSSYSNLLLKKMPNQLEAIQRPLVAETIKYLTISTF